MYLNNNFDKMEFTVRHVRQKYASLDSVALRQHTKLVYNSKILISDFFFCTWFLKCKIITLVEELNYFAELKIIHPIKGWLQPQP